MDLDTVRAVAETTVESQLSVVGNEGFVNRTDDGHYWAHNLRADKVVGASIDLDQCSATGSTYSLTARTAKILMGFLAMLDMPAPIGTAIGVQLDSHDACELTILMPCLNEAETLGRCIAKARGFLARSGITGEVLIADNGSTDGSQAIAEAVGARAVTVPECGYGRALLGGIRAAWGRYVVMGDSDESYDFSRLDEFVTKLREGHQLVMGNWFKGGILSGSDAPVAPQHWQPCTYHRGT